MSEVSRLAGSDILCGSMGCRTVGSRAEQLPAFLAGGLVLVLGFDEGGFSTSTWVWSAAPLAILAGALVLGQARRPSTIELAFLAALTGLLGWTLVSSPGRWTRPPLFSTRSGCCSTWQRPRRSSCWPGRARESAFWSEYSSPSPCSAWRASATPQSGTTSSGRSPTTLGRRTGCRTCRLRQRHGRTRRDGGAARDGSRARQLVIPPSARPAFCCCRCSSQRCTSPTRVARGLGSRSACSRSLRRESLRSTAASSSRSARSSSLR